MIFNFMYHKHVPYKYVTYILNYKSTRQIVQKLLFRVFIKASNYGLHCSISETVAWTLIPNVPYYITCVSF